MLNEIKDYDTNAYTSMQMIVMYRLFDMFCSLANAGIVLGNANIDTIRIEEDENGQPTYPFVTDLRLARLFVADKKLKSLYTLTKEEVNPYLVYEPRSEVNTYRLPQIIDWLFLQESIFSRYSTVVVLDQMNRYRPIQLFVAEYVFDNVATSTLGRRKLVNELTFGSKTIAKIIEMHKKLILTKAFDTHSIQLLVFDQKPFLSMTKAKPIENAKVLE
jgi:hypothetical protein